MQLQLVTATVKLFLKKPTEKPQQLIQLVLTYATQETDNPDLRDRAYIYWRLLSTDPGACDTCDVRALTRFHHLELSTSSLCHSTHPWIEAAKDVVLSEKPVISDTQDVLEASLLDRLLHELGTLASVYHKPSHSFISQARLAVHRAEDLTVHSVGEEGERWKAREGIADAALVLLLWLSYWHVLL